MKERQYNQGKATTEYQWQRNDNRGRWSKNETSEKRAREMERKEK